MNRQYYLRKADQESEMGCLAMQDGDKADAKLHFDKMREYRQLARELDDESDIEKRRALKAAYSGTGAAY